MAVKPPNDTTALESLRAPFDDDQIGTVRKGSLELSNVAPHHYIQKLIDSGVSYNVRLVGGPQVFKDTNGSIVTQAVAVDIEGNTFEGVGAEPIGDTSGDGFAFAVKSATSDGLKIALKHAGVGLDLYKKEPVRTSAPAPRPARQEEEDEQPQRSAPRPAARPQHRGKVASLMPFGKHKGKPFTEIPDSFLTWAQENITDKPDIAAAVEAELQRREETGDSVEDEPRQGGARKSQRRSGQSRSSVSDF